MRLLTAAVLSLLGMLALQAEGRAQAPPKVQINPEGVRVGFLASKNSSGFKTGAWSPVYVDIQAGFDRVGPADGWVVVETTDSDDMENSYRVPLPPLEAQEQTTVLTYVRTGTLGSDIQVTLRGSDGRKLWSQRANRGTFSPAPPGAFLYLTAGADSLPLRRGLLPPKVKAGGGEVETFDENDQVNAFAHVLAPLELPTRWFGYTSADVVLLHTGSPKFVEPLLADSQNRKEALAEWVRRGGRLVISVGSNHQLVKALLEKLQLIGCTPNGTVQRSSLDGVARWVGARDAIRARAGKDEKGGTVPGKVDLVKLEIEPRRGVQVLVSEPPTESDPVRRPVVVQASAGLGRVILVGFDLDKAPFAEWNEQGRLWQKLNNELRPNAARNVRPVNQNNMNGMPGWDPNHTDAGTLLQDRLEWFDEVPVISFGWVALFILIYIVIVGPLDYFFLKKVVKRLELTWITFPAVVLVVSAVAYGSAYYLKGNDLRINKVDIVDLVADPAAQQVRASRAYGTTWFTLFSPRIQNYTIGVEPAAGTWVPDLSGDKTAPRNPHSVVIGWMGRPENTWGGTGRAGTSTSLFRRTYDYAPDASGLTGVPIQVWSTKSFTASWQAALSEEKPLFQAELTRVGTDGEGLSGTLTSNLPVELEDVVLFYRGGRYALGRLSSGVPRRIDDLGIGKTGGDRRIEDWFQFVQTGNVWDQRSGRYRPSSAPSASALSRVLMFGDADTTANHPHNNSLRYLDESWRLKRSDEAGSERNDEVIIVGKAPRHTDNTAEKVAEDGVSPSRLWLGSLPASAEGRQPLKGKMLQETYVRIFLPVAPK